MYTTRQDLSVRQGYPLKAKVFLTKIKIKEFYEAHKGQVYISFSGGKDSSVLLDLAREIYPDIPGVYVNTGLEFPEITNHVMGYENIEIVRPAMNFKSVIERYGYPVVSKKVSKMIRMIRTPDGRCSRSKHLYLTGKTLEGKDVPSYKLSNKWIFLVNAPFKISDECCNILKKNPMKIYAKKTGRYPIIATMAEESATRAQAYERIGCNIIGTKNDRSTPMAFWTEQDVLEYIIQKGLKIAEPYGQIQRDGDGRLYTTGEKRTGCVFCLFGIANDGKRHQLNRIQRLAATHPKLHRYCVNNLGIGAVMKYLGYPTDIPNDPQPWIS